MKRRCLIAAGIVAACVGVMLGLAALLPDTLKTQCDRVEVGMTLEQVEGVFGTPATEVEGVPIISIGKTWRVLRRWRDADGSTADIFFEEPAGIVSSKQWEDSTETIGEKLRRWVRGPR